MKVIHAGVEYDCSESHSNRDFTGWDFRQRESLAGLVIFGSCFSQETLRTRIFSVSLVATFIACNLDNVLVPAGCVVIDCSRRKFRRQNDGEDWILNASDAPVEPIAKKRYLQLGLSVNPADIPPTPKRLSVITRRLMHDARDRSRVVLAVMADAPLPDKLVCDPLEDMD